MNFRLASGFGTVSSALDRDPRCRARPRRRRPVFRFADGHPDSIRWRDANALSCAGGWAALRRCQRRRYKDPVRPRDRLRGRRRFRRRSDASIARRLHRPLPGLHRDENVPPQQIYEGKAKILYEGPEPGTLIQYFKDDATAFNDQKKGTITGKGVLNNRISEYLMTAARARSACRPISSAGSTCASS